MDVRYKGYEYSIIARELEAIIAQKFVTTQRTMQCTTSNQASALVVDLAVNNPKKFPVTRDEKNNFSTRTTKSTEDITKVFVGSTQTQETLYHVPPPIMSTSSEAMPPTREGAMKRENPEQDKTQCL